MSRHAIRLWVFCLCLPVFCQKYPIQVLTIEDGLPQSTVQYIFQDHRGCLWFGTQQGARQWDGVRFIDPFRNFGLEINSVRQIFQSSDLGIWIATDDGLFHYGEGRQEFYTFGQEGRARSFLTIYESEPGLLWVGTENGLIMMQDTNFRIFGKEHGLPGVEIRAVVKGPQGRMWVGTNEGLAVWDGIRFTAPPVKTPAQTVNAMLTHEKDGIWIALDEGLGYLNNSGFHMIENLEHLPHKVITTLARDRRGDLWVGTENGISRMIPGINMLEPSFENITVENGLSNGKAYSILEDREGNLWVGTDIGAAKIGSLAFVGFTVDQGLTSDAVWAVMEDKEGRIWLGTERGVNIIGKDQKVTSLDEEDGLHGKLVRTLAQDPSGAVWVGTTTGLSRYDQGRFQIIGKGEDLAEAFIRDIVVDREGRIWVATDRDGVFSVTPSETGFVVSQEALPNTRVFSVFEDVGGRMWFASESGLCLFGTNRLRCFTTQDGLPHNRILSLTQDRRGRIWVGTDNGLASFLEGRFTSYLKSEGLSDTVCYFVLDDHQDQIWVGTNKGVSRWDGMSFTNYSSLNGLVYDEMNVGAATEDHYGRLWFGSYRGVTRLDPSLLRRNQAPPPVYITDFNVNGVSYPTSDPVELDHDQNYLSIDFTAYSYTIPQKVLFRYMLRGLDREWKEGTDRGVRYNALPPGEYTFTVEARNEDGVWSKEPAEVQFAIQPPVWKQTWFLVFSFVFALGLVYWRIKDLQHRNEILAKEAHMLHRQVEAERAVELSQRAELLLLHSQMNPHFLQNALTTAIYFADTNTEKAKLILRKLSQIFRLNHQATIDGWSTLEAEKKLIDNYMDIQLMRFSDRLLWESHCQEDTLQQIIPGFIIQPLVENAVVHGLRNSLDMVTVRLDVKRKGNQIHVVVSNNGQPLPRPLKYLLSEEHALGNINKRLRLLYGHELNHDYRDGIHYFSLTLLARIQ